MKLKALVIDDSRVMRMIVMKNLVGAQLADFDFIEAGDGAEGLAQFRAHDVQIVFVDWNMPQMTGIDFICQARALGKAPVPMVMITSERAKCRSDEAFQVARVDAYIYKPFTAADLSREVLPVIQGILAQPAAEPPAPEQPGCAESQLVPALA